MMTTINGRRYFSVVCHDGTIFKFSPDLPIDWDTFDSFEALADKDPYAHNVLLDEVFDVTGDYPEFLDHTEHVHVLIMPVGHANNPSVYRPVTAALKNASRVARDKLFIYGLSTDGKTFYAITTDGFRLVFDLTRPFTPIADEYLPRMTDTDRRALEDAKRRASHF